MKGMKRYQHTFLTEKVSDYLQKSLVSDVNVLNSELLKADEEVKISDDSICQKCTCNLPISAADVRIECLFNMTQNVITYCYN